MSCATLAKEEASKAEEEEDGETTEPKQHEGVEAAEGKRDRATGCARGLGKTSSAAAAAAAAVYMLHENGSSHRHIK